MNNDARVRSVVFDLDGLMFNTEELYTEVGEELLRRRGKRISRELLDAMMGRPSRVALQIMIDWCDLDATVAELEADTDSLFAEILPARLAPMPGLLDLLEALRSAGIPRGIATSSRRSFVDNVLRQSGLASQFPLVLTAEDVVRGKPDPEIYQTAAKRLGQPPERMMVLEDSENGCRSAVAAGAFTVAVPGEHSRGHDFSGVAFVAQGLADPRIYGALGIEAP